MKGWRLGVQAATPTMMGYLSIGLAYGIVASESGLTSVETLLTSLVVYSGSGQFVLCALLLAGSDLVSIALTVFLTNLRHFLMNLHVATFFPDIRLREQLLIGSFVTDESYGVLLEARLRGEGSDKNWMYGNNFASYAMWCFASLVGSLLGTLLPNPAVLGIDFALVAMFVAIFYGQLEGMAKRLPVTKICLILITVFLVYLIAAYVMASSLAVLLATIIACLVGVMTDD